MQIVKISAFWCSTCLLTIRELKKVKEIWPDLKIIDVDYNDHEETAKYNILNIPTLIIQDDNGKELERIEGFKRKEELLEIINKYYV